VATVDTTLDAEMHQASHAHVAHHFESAQQQFDAGKLGMWLFLVTEVLFFSGLCVAYAVYRANHTVVFLDAHQYLNTTLGALNTIVLLLSSLTMAWSVRCAQLGQQRGLVILLTVTLACASLFLGVKAIEYSHKWDAGLLWAGAFSTEIHTSPHAGNGISKSLVSLSVPALLTLAVSMFGLVWSRSVSSDVKGRFWLSIFVAAAAFFGGTVIGYGVEHLTASDHHHDLTAHPAATEALVDKPLTGVFFSIYFAMTGVHAIHILAGMGVLAWLLARALRHDFGPDYFGPVDYVGLYWHLVDLVWIYLFPLLYLIR